MNGSFTEFILVAFFHCINFKSVINLFIGDALSKVSGEGVKLTMISNRGVKVWPGGHAETFCSDHWRCRFVAETGEGSAVTPSQVIALLQRLNDAGLDVIKTENLYYFDGAKAYSA
jgi:isocitrate dehydrogenase